MKRIYLVVLALALLAVGGCTPPPPIEPTPEVTGEEKAATHSAKFMRDVKDVEAF